MTFGEVPGSAAWQHRGARTGFESMFWWREGDGYRLEGSTAAVEAGRAWAVHYAILVDEIWRTKTARIWGLSLRGDREVRLDADGLGHWEVDGSPVSALDGCFDVDLESSACTNTLPVHRLGLGVGQTAEAPAAYVRADGLGVERIEQRYTRLPDDGSNHQYDYVAPGFDFECRLAYDDDGFVLEYPGIASRVL